MFRYSDIRCHFESAKNHGSGVACWNPFFQIIELHCGSAETVFGVHGSRWEGEFSKYVGPEIGCRVWLAPEFIGFDFLCI